MQKKGSAAKRHRQSIKSRARNRSVRTLVRNRIKAFRAAVDGNDRETAARLYRQAESELDKAVSKGVLHRNTAARKKSRLGKALAKLQQ